MLLKERNERPALSACPVAALGTFSRSVIAYDARSSRADATFTGWERSDVKAHLHRVHCSKNVNRLCQSGQRNPDAIYPCPAALLPDTLVRAIQNGRPSMRNDILEGGMSRAEVERDSSTEVCCCAFFQFTLTVQMGGPRDRGGAATSCTSASANSIADSA